MCYGQCKLPLLLSLVICLLLAEVSPLLFPSGPDDICRTPTNEEGVCVNIKDCEPIINALLNAPKPLSPQTVKKLRNYTCGYEAKNALVCCPPSPVIINPNIGKLVPEPPDVSEHPNFYLLPTTCGRFDTIKRIRGGQNTSLLEFPWMALLSYNTSNGPDFKCGGTIINDKYILTAAHCLKNLKYPIIAVRVGEHDLTENIDCQTDEDGEEECAPPIQDLMVEEVIIHEGFNVSTLNHDVGLIRVKGMKYAKNVRPVCLPIEQSRNYNFTGKGVVVTGWGATEKERFSPYLLKVELPVVPLERCRDIYKRNVPIIYTQMCAGGKDNKDSCPGDSGGPLHVADFLYDDIRYVQQGIVSFGPRICGKEGLPGVYTRVGYYMDWMLRKMRS